MEGIFIISDYSKWLESLIEKLDLKETEIISFKNDLDEDWKMDFWVKSNLPDTLKLILIPIELGNNNSTSLEGLRIAMHLRLLNADFSKRYVPIVFVSTRDEWQISKMCRDNRDNNHLNYLIGTKGTDLLKPNADDIKAVIPNLQTLNEQEYKYDFYDHVKIVPSENIGKHSLANIWGAYKLAQSTGHINEIEKKPELKKRQSDIYFKYVNALNNIANFKEIPPQDTRTIQTKKKNILFIDDEAEKGWDIVLKSIFNDSNFVSVSRDQSEIFKTFYNRAESEALKKTNNLPYWDLILLDLRLDEKEDLGDQANKLATEYSGAELLNKIKNFNSGIQVIMFTASNKAWNMRELFDSNADGFFIKESPEFSSDFMFSIKNYENFEEQVITCLNRTFLKEFIYKTKIIKSTLKKSLWNSKSTSDEQLIINDFEIMANLKLDIAFELVEKVTDFNRNSKMRMAFLQLYQILEDFVKLEFIYLQSQNVKLPSKVFKKDLTAVEVFGPDKKIAGNITCNIKFNRGKYTYQTNESDPTITSVIFSAETFKHGLQPKSQTQETSLFKLINVFKERHNYDELRCNDIIELTYLRSNLGGHETGNIKKTRDINEQDLIKLISIIESIGA